MKKVVFIVLVAMFFNCKNEEKKQQEIKQTDTDKITYNQEADSLEPRDITEIIFESFNEGQEVNALLGKQFAITKVSIIPDTEGQEVVYISFLLEDEITEINIENYELELSVFPYEADLDLLQDVAMQKERNYDTWNFKPKLVTINNRSFFYKIIGTTITEFRQIYVHLYDLTKKDFVQESVILKDVKTQY